MKPSLKKIISPFYLTNIIIQSIVSLVSPMLIMLLFAWLMVTRLGVGPWIYVVFIMLGVFSGLYSMVAFIINASRALEAIEKQNQTSNERKN